MSELDLLMQTMIDRICQAGVAGAPHWGIEDYVAAIQWLVKNQDTSLPPVTSSSPLLLSDNDVRVLNTAAAHLQIGLALSAAEQFTIAARLFELAGNPMPEQAVREYHFTPDNPRPTPVTW